jgi:hypothetical protein
MPTEHAVRRQSPCVTMDLTTLNSSFDGSFGPWSWISESKRLVLTTVQNITVAGERQARQAEPILRSRPILPITESWESWIDTTDRLKVRIV